MIQQSRAAVKRTGLLFSGVWLYICCQTQIMATTKQNAVESLLQQIATAARHPYYNHTHERREWCEMIAQGTGQNEELKKFRRFEDDDLAKQRDRLTVPLTKYVIERPRKYWKKVWRADRINFTTTSGAPKEKVAAFLSKFQRFADRKGLEEWVNFTLEDLGVNDPNAWIIYDRVDRRDADLNTAETRVQPWVASCEEAVMWTKEMGRLDSLTLRFERPEVVVGKKGTATTNVLQDFRFYFAGGIVTARQRGLTGVEQEGEALMEINVAGQTKPVQFFVRLWDNGTKEVPAAPAGAYADTATKRETFVPWYWPAEHVFTKLIRHTSSLDVTEALHLFAKRWEYTRACTFAGEEGSCEGRGYLGNNKNHTCPSCKGQGAVLVQATDQRVSYLKMPKSQTAAELLDLARLSYTEPVNIELANYLVARLTEDERRVWDAVFSAGMMDRADAGVPETATKTNYTYEDLYDVLYSFSQALCEHIELAYRVGAQYEGLNDFQVSYQIPRDLKMKDIDTLLGELEKMRKSGAGYDAMQAVRAQIIAKTAEFDKGRVAAALIRYEWLPWDDKTAEETAQIVASRSPLDPQRVLWENWAEIFRQIEQEQTAPPFHELTRALQQAAIDKKVAEFSARIVSADTTPQIDVTQFNEPDPVA